MWKCTKCGTLNQEESCSSCGAHWTSGKQIEETPAYEEQYSKQEYSQQPYAYQNKEVYSAQDTEEIREQKNNGLIITIVICVTIIVAMLLALGAYIFMQREERAYRHETETEKEIVRVIEKEVPVAVPTQEPTSTPSEIPELEPTATPAPKKNNNAAKRQEFLNRAQEIESFAQAAGDAAMNQSEINQASAEIFKKWDALLNDVYQYLKGTMPTGEFNALKKEEVAWIKRKEAAMDATAKEWEGGSGAPMAVNGVGTEYTKERCYELINKIR